MGGDLATDNQVTITGSTISKFTYDSFEICGGRSDKEASDNRVTIANSSFNNYYVIKNLSKIYGGYISNNGGSTTDNIVNLYGTVQGLGAVIGGNKANTGNALHLGGTADGQTVNDIPFAPWTDSVYNEIPVVENFEKIVFHQVKWDTSNPALEIGSLTNFGGVLDISDMAFANDTAAGTMRLLKGKSGDFSTLDLTYKSGDSTVTASLGGDSPTSCVVRQGTAAEESAATNGVKLAWRADEHSVSIADSSKVAYTIGNYVTGVTLGEIAWNAGGTARTLTTEEQALYTFNANTAIDASGLTFTGTSATDPMNQSVTLLAGATNITGGHITQPGDGKGEVAVDYTDEKGIKFDATASGTVGVDSGAVKYTVDAVAVNKATLGSFAWGAKADSLPDGWTASAATTIDATNFEYTCMVYDQVYAGVTSTILDAPGLTKDSKVEGGTNIEIAVENTDYMGIKFEATATGHVEVEVEATEQKVQYRVDSVTLKNVDLGGWDWDWDGTVSIVPHDWTGSQVTVSTGNFNVPALAAGESIDILTTSVANYFGTVSGDRKYSSETFENSEAGVTLSGNHFGGVKVEAYGEAANAKLTYYAETMGTTDITLGEMTWDTGRAAGTGYDFRNVGTIDASKLTFNFTSAQAGDLSASSKMTLLSGATNLAADKDVTGKDKTQTIDYSTANGAALSGTLKGIVSTSAGAVNYDATAMTLDSVNLAKWDGKTSSEVPEGWTASLGNDSVTAAGFTAPTLDAGTSTNILTTTTNNLAQSQILWDSSFLT